MVLRPIFGIYASKLHSIVLYHFVPKNNTNYFQEAHASKRHLNLLFNSLLANIIKWLHAPDCPTVYTPE
jgi:hypothetical protein